MHAQVLVALHGEGEEELVIDKSLVVDHFAHVSDCHLLGDPS